MSAAALTPDRRAMLGCSLALASAVAASAVPVPAEVTPHPDASLLALAEEMERSKVRDAELLQVCMAAGNNLEADLAWEAHGYADKEIKERIARTPATTLDGLAIKARAIAYIYRDEFCAAEMGLTEATDQRLIWSILADLAPAHLVAPPEPAATGEAA